MNFSIIKPPTLKIESTKRRLRKSKDSLNVVVTGGTKGLGKAMVKEFVDFGDNVYVVSRSKADIDKLKKEIPGLHGCAFDVGSQIDVDNMMKDALNHLGSVDILVNNAGMSGGSRSFNELQEDAIEKIVHTNLIGTMLCCKAGYGIMNESSTGGAIFNMVGAGSNGGSTPLYSVYGSSKAGVLQFTKSLQSEWRQSLVDVHVVSPGLMFTNLLLENLDTDTFEVMRKFCSEPDLVAHHIVPQMRRTYLYAHEDVYIQFLTIIKILTKMVLRL